MDRSQTVSVSVPFLLMTGALAGVFLLHPLAMSFFGNTGAFPESLVAVLERSRGDGMFPMTIAFGAAGLIVAVALFNLVEQAAQGRPTTFERTNTDHHLPCVRCARRFSLGHGVMTPSFPEDRTRSRELCPRCRSALVEGLLRGLSRWGRDGSTTRPAPPR